MTPPKRMLALREQMVFFFDHLCFASTWYGTGHIVVIQKYVCPLSEQINEQMHEPFLSNEIRFSELNLKYSCLLISQKRQGLSRDQVAPTPNFTHLGIKWSFNVSYTSLLRKALTIKGDLFWLKLKKKKRRRKNCNKFCLCFPYS